MRKTAPFPIETAQLSYVPGQPAVDGQEFVVSVARRDVIEEYEQVAAAEGAHAGIVNLATFNVVNAVLAGSSSRLPPTGDCLVVHVAADYATLVVLRGPHVILFRNRTAETDGTLADVVHQTTMYFEDRLGGAGFSRVILVGTAGAARPGSEIDEARRSLQERLTTPVDALDLRSTIAVTDRSGAASFDTLTPVVGVLLRGREQAA